MNLKGSLVQIQRGPATVMGSCFTYMPLDIIWEGVKQQ